MDVYGVGVGKSGLIIADNILWISEKKKNHQ